MNGLSYIDQVSIVGLAGQIQARTGASNISSLAKRYGVPTMSEYRNRQTIADRLNAVHSDADTLALAEAKRTAEVATAMLKVTLEKSLGIVGNKQRNTYAPWLKHHVAGLLISGTPYKVIADVTGISEETLRHFREDHVTDLKPAVTSDDHIFIRGVWNQAPHRNRRNFEAFWSYLGHTHGDRAFSREVVRQILIDLGLHSPRTAKIKNKGTSVKTEFTPNAIWEGDGKQLNITVNGIRHTFCWYAFCDQRTTLIVGSSITGAESSKAFIDALKDGNQSQGTYAIGVLIDNRLGETDLSAVKSFCKEHNIIIGRTFPGNSKSNGFIESTFGIFERYVGDLNVTGANSQEIAASLAEVIVEIFTQQRNHTPRKRLGSRSPADYPTPDRQPEYIREAIERLANRFNRETVSIEFKWDLILEARAHFGLLSEPTQHKLMKQLGKYPAADLLSAQSKYLAQIIRHPDQTYRSEYFMAIVRNNREEIAKRTFNEAWRAGVERMHALFPPPVPIPAKDRAKDILEVLTELLHSPSPSEWMMELDALAWWFVQYSTYASLPELCIEVEKAVETSKLMSSRQWEKIKDYLSSRLGKLLYPAPAVTAEAQYVPKKSDGDAPPVITNSNTEAPKKSPVRSPRHPQSPNPS